MAGNRTSGGRFAAKNTAASGHDGSGAGRPSKRHDGRHWLSRNYELPEAERSKVAFSPADAATRRVVAELKKMKGRDLVSAVLDIHADLYGKLTKSENQNFDATTLKVFRVGGHKP